MKNVDVIILSLCNSEEKYRMNTLCLKTLHDSESEIRFNVVIVESNADFTGKWTYQHEARIITPNEPFNYNRFVNIAMKECDADYICISNNDVLFSPGWMSEIISCAEKNKEVASFSPFDPNAKFQAEAIKGKDVAIGYRVRSELVGWCLVMKKSIKKFIYPLDENFDYYFQDNDYSYTLRRNNIQHALVAKSIVNHLENMTSKESDEYHYLKRGRADELKFLAKWGSYKSLSRKNRIHGFINHPLLRWLSVILYSRYIRL